jgi:MoaA/NifB/PqqE/SkfB family radical SAM enzyme
MAPEFFEKVLQQVAPLTKMVALHLMGDPLVHPNLETILSLCEKYQVRVFLVTNGVLLREKETQLLLHPVLRQISFSLHSFPDNFGEKDPSVYLERVFHFTRQAFTHRPDLFINYRLWNLQADRSALPAHQGILRKIESEFGHPLSHLGAHPQKRHAIGNRLSLHFDTEFIWPSLELPERGSTGTCQGLSSHIGILVDGTVVPCCLDKEGVIALGTLTSEKLTDILASERAQKMRVGFQTGELVEDLCRRCQYIERFSVPANALSGKLQPVVI